MELRSNESVDKALKRFKKICDREGLYRDIQKNARYEKPSEQRRREDVRREKQRAKEARQATKKKLKRQRARKKAMKKAATQWKSRSQGRA